jgi:hypothetical protein
MVDFLSLYLRKNPPCPDLCMVLEAAGMPTPRLPDLQSLGKQERTE